MKFFATKSYIRNKKEECIMQHIHNQEKFLPKSLTNVIL